MSSKSASAPGPRTLSLFSGAGGLDIGFHQAGFRIVAAVEIEPAYAETLLKNTGEGRFFGPSTEVHCTDIRDFDATEYSSAGIELVIGGPPCQTFSAAGRRSGGVLGLGDARGNLFQDYVKILKILQPRAFVFENVYGLPGANGGRPWKEINQAFAEAGYTLFADIFDAADFGVPQHRERLIMVGLREGEFQFPAATFGPDAVTGKKLVSAREVLKDISDPDEVPGPGPGGLYGHLLPSVPPGLNYSFLTSEMGHPAPQFAWRSKFHDFLHKASPDKPVRTIKSKPGKFTGPFHWNNRHFTADELKRLQSFPDEYEIAGSYNKIVEQIGNSVPPRLAYAFALAVRNQVFGDDSFGTIRTRSDSFVSTFRKRQRERSAEFKQIAQEAIAKIETVDRPGAHGGRAYRMGVTGTFLRDFDARTRKGFDSTFIVETKRSDDALAMTVASESESVLQVQLAIDGLYKYLVHTDSLRVDAIVGSLEDLQQIWAAVEYEIVSMSRFYSLIDVYGHYANRGDSVSVRTTIDSNDPLMRAVAFFGSSDRCGIRFSESQLASLLEVRDGQVSQLVDQLRALRIDARSSRTHPTLASGEVLVTYPFPSLSKKAHFKT